jgi:hypothetical protein
MYMSICQTFQHGRRTVGCGIEHERARDDPASIVHRVGVEAPGENALLRMQAVFRLVEHHRLM